MSTNLYALFRRILPESPLQVGEVLSVNNGVLTLGLPGGGTDQARGAGTVGDRVYFRDGAVEGPAPSLPVELIEV